MTVAELRKALEGLPDDAEVAYIYDGYLFEVTEVETVLACRKQNEHRGEFYPSPHGKPIFVVAA